LVSLTCLTGSVITFRDEADRARWPRSTAAAAAAPSVSLVAAARAIGRAQPGAQITRVTFPPNPNDPYIFQFKSADKETHRVAVDASSGQVLGELPKVAWMDWLVDLHRNLLAGRTGRQIIGGVGGVCLALGSTGLLLWAIRGGSWRAWLRIRRNSGSRPFNFDLHRVSGLWTLLFIVALSFTGMELAYPQSFRNTWERVTGQPASVRAFKPVKAASGLTKSLYEYLVAGEAAMPDGVPTEMRISDSPNASVYLRLRRAGDLSPAGLNRVYLDPVTCRVLSAERTADRPLGVQLFQAVQPVHYGQFGGLPVKLLWAFLGATPALLFVTGLLVWWRPTKKGLRPKVHSEKPVRELPKEDSLAELLEQ